ncbi:MAG: rod shape-determining protein MreD [Wenzhouxiangellaceae bacterium]|nr:rod shape-determining protein MreD [Wenzhouxiangellaceae bacterium]MBS3747459.1 rod shape-determining protein MreD [Wenzhouxiangellaceae bacterium]MBS3822282.1 rod shape-determining protein MreD [Wenzhouxiangellaceae bacterium]
MNRTSSMKPALTVLAAIALALVPMPDALDPWRPYWAALVMIYWHLETSRLQQLGTAFVIGIALDLTTGTLLGQHALGLVIINFLVGRFRNRLRFFPPWQQALAVGALLFNDRIVQLWIIGLLERGWPDWTWWLPPLIGMLLWPWIFLLLDALRSQRRTVR